MRVWREQITSGGGFIPALAVVISACTSPFVVTGITITLVVLLLRPSLHDLLAWATVCIVCGALFPFLFVFRLWRKGSISDIHVAVREQRGAPFLAALLSTAVGVELLYAMRAPEQLVALGCVYLAIGLILTLVSLRWKISVHSAVLATCIVALALIGYPNSLYGLLVVPLVLWARVYRKKHTLAQGLVPVALATVIAPMVYWGALALIPDL